jgi:hypothetical protein
MKVFVLSEHYIEDTYILGVYSSAELADEKRAECRLANPSAYHKFDVQVFELDAAPEES